MFKKLRILSLMYVLMFTFSVNIEASGRIQDQMLQDLDVVKYQLSIKYGPTEWKNEYFGWDLEESYQKARMRILEENPSTAQDYQKILSWFLGSTKDYHVQVAYHSTALSFFPLGIKKAGEHYYFIDSNINFSMDEVLLLGDEFTQADRGIMINNKGIPNVGDEIIEFDGRPIREVVEELIDENFNGDRSSTGYEFAVRNLFYRKASLGHSVPEGAFTLTIKNQKTRKYSVFVFPWMHVAELVPNPLLADRCTSTDRNEDSFSSITLVERIESLIAKDFSVGIAKDFGHANMLSLIKNKKPLKKQDKKRRRIEEEEDEREKGFLPVLGDVLWESSKTEELYAYLYLDPKTGKPIGYIYIPTFDLQEAQSERYLAQFIEVLKVFNARAKGLVLDITDNPGGNMLFMYGILSALTDRPLKVPSQRETLIPEDVKNMAILYKILESIPPLTEKSPKETMSGYLFTNKLIRQMKNYASTIVKTWESGEVFTRPLYCMGIDEIMPRPKLKFKDKPIMVLVNSFCFSCGDFFPAILQDNKKALIFGEKTAGAGGYVRPYQHASRFGVRGYSLTGSIAFRLDGTTIENLGVTPDIPYSITEKDLREKYSDYIKKVNLTMKNLMVKQ